MGGACVYNDCLLCNKLRMKPHPRWGGGHARTGGDYRGVCVAFFFFEEGASIGRGNVFPFQKSSFSVLSFCKFRFIHKITKFT